LTLLRSSNCNLLFDLLLAQPLFTLLLDLQLSIASSP
jgi:hypothetical protein